MSEDDSDLEHSKLDNIKTIKGPSIKSIDSTYSSTTSVSDNKSSKADHSKPSLYLNNDSLTSTKSVANFPATTHKTHLFESDSDDDLFASTKPISTVESNRIPDDLGNKTGNEAESTYSLFPRSDTENISATSKEPFNKNISQPQSQMGSKLSKQAPKEVRRAEDNLYVDQDSPQIEHTEYDRTTYKRGPSCKGPSCIGKVDTPEISDASANNNRSESNDQINDVDDSKNKVASNLEKSIFDDDSEEEDLFKPVSETSKPSNQESTIPQVLVHQEGQVVDLLDTSDFKGRNTTLTKMIPDGAKGHALFSESSDDDDMADLFDTLSGQQSTVVLSKDEDSASNSSSIHVKEANVGAPKGSPKGSPKGGISLFGSKGGDIASAIKARNRVHPTESNDSNKVLREVPNLPQPNNVNIQGPTQEAKPLSARNLFDEDDSDDDGLFSSLNVHENKAVNVRSNHGYVNVHNQNDNSDCISTPDKANDTVKTASPKLPDLPKPKKPESQTKGIPRELPILPHQIKVDSEAQKNNKVSGEDSSNTLKQPNNLSEDDRQQGTERQKKKPFGGVSLFGPGGIDVTKALKPPKAAKASSGEIKSSSNLFDDDGREEEEFDALFSSASIQSEVDSQDQKNIKVSGEENSNTPKQPNNLFEDGSQQGETTANERPKQKPFGGVSLFGPGGIDVSKALKPRKDDRGETDQNHTAVSKNVNTHPKGLGEDEDAHTKNKKAKILPPQLPILPKPTQSDSQIKNMPPQLPTIPKPKYKEQTRPLENIMVSREGSSCESWDKTSGNNTSDNLSTDIQSKAPRIPKGGIPVPMFGAHVPKPSAPKVSEMKERIFRPSDNVKIRDPAPILTSQSHVKVASQGDEADGGVQSRLNFKNMLNQKLGKNIALGPSPYAGGPSKMSRKELSTTPDDTDQLSILTGTTIQSGYPQNDVEKLSTDEDRDSIGVSKTQLLDVSAIKNRTKANPKRRLPQKMLNQPAFNDMPIFDFSHTFDNPKVNTVDGVVDDDRSVKALSSEENTIPYPTSSLKFRGNKKLSSPGPPVITSKFSSSVLLGSAASNIALGKNKEYQDEQDGATTELKDPAETDRIAVSTSSHNPRGSDENMSSSTDSNELFGTRIPPMPTEIKPHTHINDPLFGSRDELDSQDDDSSDDLFASITRGYPKV